MKTAWEALNATYEAALMAIREALENAERDGVFTKAIVSKDHGIYLFRENARGSLLHFPQFVCGDPNAPEAQKAAFLLEAAGFGTGNKLKAWMALDSVTLIRHSNGLVLVRGYGVDQTHGGLAATPKQ